MNAGDAGGAATEQVAELLAATPPAPAPVEEVARPEPVAAVPPPPLPKRKPADEPVAALEPLPMAEIHFDAPLHEPTGPEVM